MRRGLVILVVTVLAGLLISWFVMSLVPPQDQMKVEDPNKSPYQGATPNAQKYADQPAK